jgi:hypothetical protein
MRRTTFGASALALLLVCACTRNEASHGNAAQQAPKGLTPSGSAGSPVHGSEAMGANPHGGAGNDPHAGVDMGRGQNPHGGMDMGGASPKVQEQDPNTILAGTIEVAPALAEKVKAGDTIFLSVRAIDEAGNVIRMPLAVDRVDFQKSGQAFLLSNQNQMVEGSNKLVGNLQITARLDRDQEAMTRAPGDIEGIVKTTPPKKDLKLVLDTEVK